MKISGCVAPFIRWAAPSYRNLSQWIEIYQGIISSRGLAASTLKDKIAMLNFIKSMASKKILRDITPLTIRQLVGHYTSKNKIRSAQILRTLLNDIFDEAINAGWLVNNPASSIRRPKLMTHRERLTLTEWQEIYNAAKDVCPSYFPVAMQLTLVTGQRRSDISSMRRSQIENNFLFIQQVKSGSKIAIPLQLRLESAGLLLSDIIQNCNGHDYVLNKKRVSPHSLTYLFCKARRAAYEDSYWTNTPPSFHEQRSLAERLYREQGIYTKRLLGHKYQKTTDSYNNDYNKEWKEIAI